MDKRSGIDGRRSWAATEKIIFLIKKVISTQMELNAALFACQIINMYGELIMEKTQHQVNEGVFFFPLLIAVLHDALTLGLMILALFSGSFFQQLFPQAAGC